MDYSYINHLFNKSAKEKNRMPFYTVKTIDEQSLDQSKVKDVISGFKNYTTVHGVPHISKAKGMSYYDDKYSVSSLLWFSTYSSYH